jgi:hypothetical protein
VWLETPEQARRLIVGGATAAVWLLYALALWRTARRLRGRRHQAAIADGMRKHLAAVGSDTWHRRHCDDLEPSEALRGPADVSPPRGLPGGLLIGGQRSPARLGCSHAVVVPARSSSGRRQGQSRSFSSFAVLPLQQAGGGGKQLLARATFDSLPGAMSQQVKDGALATLVMAGGDGGLSSASSEAAGRPSSKWAAGRGGRGARYALPPSGGGGGKGGVEVEAVAAAASVSTSPRSLLSLGKRLLGFLCLSYGRARCRRRRQGRGGGGGGGGAPEWARRLRRRHLYCAALLPPEGGSIDINIGAPPLPPPLERLTVLLVLATASGGLIAALLWLLATHCARDGDDAYPGGYTACAEQRSAAEGDDDSQSQDSQSQLGGEGLLGAALASLLALPLRGALLAGFGRVRARRR